MANKAHMVKVLPSTFLYEEARKRLEELKRIQSVLEKRMKEHPQGKVHIINSSNRIQYYLRLDSSDSNGKYMSKSDENIIKKYVQKRYDEKLYKLICTEILGIEKLIKKSEGIVEKIRDVYSNNPEEVKKFILPYDISDEDYAEKWMLISYEGKVIKEDVPVFITDKGDKVRSKSELIIANRLYKLNIPYKYEHPLLIGNEKIIYPDFTVLDKNRRCEVYWEHRGIMDNENYAIHSVRRIKQYEKNGIFLGDRLIITEEAASDPLGTDEIERIIMHYFVEKRI